MRLEKNVKSGYGEYKVVIINENDLTRLEVYREDFMKGNVPAYVDIRYGFVDNYIEFVKNFIKHYETNRLELSREEAFDEWDGTL